MNISEYDLIEKYFRKLAIAKESLALRDDAAIINSFNNNSSLVVTVDMLVENQHFFSTDEPASIATKLLNVNLSDLAAMGALPKFWLLSMALPKSNRKININNKWLEQFSNTLQQIQQQNNFYLIGGDTTASEQELVLSVTAFGEVENSKKPLRKNSAKEGDYICISNIVGDAYVGYKILKGDFSVKGEAEYYINKYKYPQAQVKLGNILLDYATSCADISDGLISDLYNICKQSKVCGTIEIENIRFSKFINNYVNTNNLEDLLPLLTFGDDYQLVFTVAPYNFVTLQNQCQKHNIFLQKIGQVTEPDKENNLKVFFNNKLVKIEKTGFQHLFSLPVI